MKFQTIHQAEEYLFSFIPHGVTFTFPGELGLERTRFLLQLLDSPQNKLKVIHIAGTSGKGSTAFYISQILRKQGFKVGLQISPHLVDIRERFQINNELISERKLFGYLNQLQSVINKMEQSAFGKPTYFELVVALAYFIFIKEKVDYAVIETGLGGLYDATNVVDSSSKVCVITRIGHDHMEILGKTLDKIASQKAGIIQKGNVVFTLNQHHKAQRVIEAVSRKKHAQLLVVKKNTAYKNISITNGKVQFDFSFLDTVLSKIILNTPALYQVENCSLALAVFFYLQKRDRFNINDKTIKSVLEKVTFNGRMEIVHHLGKTIILDGAHNPQKMKAFVNSFKNSYPKNKANFLFAVKKGKDFRDMMKYILPIAREIVLTNFFSHTQGIKLKSEEPNQVSTYLKNHHYTKVRIEKEPIEAYKKVLKLPGEIIIVTGSLYLMAELYPFIKKSKLFR